VIASQSVNCVERFIVVEGHTAERVENDYGYDLILFTFDEEGYFEPGLIRLQLKASETLTALDKDYVFDLDIRDYNLWMIEPMPVYLILYDASRRRAFWAYIQHYFTEDLSRQPRQGAKTVRVHVPMRQALNRCAVARMRLAKQCVLAQYEGVIHHV
jgi:hypothetical protein